MKPARKFGLCFAALFALLAPAAAQEAFPSRPIKFVVPLAAGGGIDFTARVTAQKLSEVIGQQVVVDNTIALIEGRKVVSCLNPDVLPAGQRP